MRFGAVFVAMVGLGLAVSSVEATAQGFPGDGVLSGRAKLKVKGCGRGKADVAVDVLVDADGTWMASDGTSAFSGTGGVGGKGGRRLTIALDTDSTATLIGRIETDAGTLCGDTVTATNVEARKTVLKVNGKRTRAKLILVYVGTGVGSDGAPGKAKYRLVVSGAWNGPLDCPEIVECRESCIGQPPECADACLARGTLATQATAMPLFDCLANACPTGDFVCEDAALSTVCADELEDCLGPPPPVSDFTCEEIFECRADCDPDFEDCPDACLDRGTSDGRDEANDVLDCLEFVCPTGAFDCLSAALIGFCSRTWEECTGTRPPTGLSCGRVIDCLATCPVGAPGCRSDCRDRGSTAAKVQLVALDACLDAACPTRDPQCVDNTVTGQCAPEWSDCLF